MPINRELFLSFHFLISRISVLPASFIELNCILPGLQQKMEVVIGGERSALIFGFLFGLKTSLSDTVKNEFKILGLYHLLSASGYHVSLVTTILKPIQMRIKNSILQFLLISMGLVSYAVLSGLADTILRAVLMNIYLLVCKMLLRRRSSGWAALIGTVIFLIGSGIVELNSVGFQLSVVAMIGLLVYGALSGTPSDQLISFCDSEHLHKHQSSIAHAMKVLGQFQAMNCAATLFTMPLLLYYFGNTSYAGLAMNIVILWFAPIIMYLTLLTISLSLLPPVPFISELFHEACNALTWFIDVFLQISSISARLLYQVSIQMKFSVLNLCVSYFTICCGCLALFYVRWRMHSARKWL